MTPLDPNLARLAAAPTPTGDKLDAVRTMVKEVRDLQLEIKGAEERLADRKRRLVQLTGRDLVDMFDATGIDRLGLEPEGNLAGYDAVARPFYHANIAADWAEDRRQAAFSYLEKQGAGDLVRTEYVISFGKGERRAARQFEDYLRGRKLQFASRLAVPWNTLTAWLREQVEKHKVVPPLDLLGATVGRVVELKQRRSS